MSSKKKSGNGWETTVVMAGDPVTTHKITDAVVGCTAVIKSRLRMIVGNEDIAVDFLGARIVDRAGKIVKDMGAKEAAALSKAYDDWRIETSPPAKFVDGVPEIDQAAMERMIKQYGKITSDSQTRVGNRVVDGDVEPIEVPRVPGNPLEKLCSGPKIS